MQQSLTKGETKMPFKHDEERAKLIERLKNELPEDTQFQWDELGCLTIAHGTNLIKLDYNKNTTYPKAEEDFKNTITAIKKTLKADLIQKNKGTDLLFDGEQSA